MFFRPKDNPLVGRCASREELAPTKRWIATRDDFIPRSQERLLDSLEIKREPVWLCCQSCLTSNHLL